MNGPLPKAPSREQQSSRATKSARFPRSARILKHADFERVYEQGQRHFARHFTAFFLPAAGSGARFGFTVGRVLGGAVERNRIKRRLREAVRQQRRRVRAGVYVVINPKKSVMQAEFSELTQEMGRALEIISVKLRSGPASKK